MQSVKKKKGANLVVIGRPKITGRNAHFVTRIRVDASTGCWEFTGARSSAGYGAFWDGQRLVRAHRYAFEQFCSPIPEGLIICHACDNPGCVNPHHLWLGTQADNAADKFRKGRGNIVKGEAHPHARLTASEVLAIRADARMHVEIASEYGIHPGCVSQIKRRVTWRHLPDSRPTEGPRPAVPA